MDFSDASFDESDSNVQPVPGVDNIDVVFPISDDGGFSVAQSDNRGASSSSVGLGTGPASAIALMPDQATSSVMEEFLFEFDNDLDHDDDKDTPNVQGLKEDHLYFEPRNQENPNFPGNLPCGGEAPLVSREEIFERGNSKKIEQHSFAPSLHRSSLPSNNHQLFSCHKTHTKKESQ